MKFTKYQWKRLLQHLDKKQLPLTYFILERKIEETEDNEEFEFEWSNPTTEYYLNKAAFSAGLTKREDIK